MKNITAEQLRKKIFNDLGTKYITKKMIEVLEEKDLVDALHTLDIVKEYFELKHNELISGLTQNNNA